MKAINVTIAKVSLTVTAKDKTITYGNEPTNDGVTYDGFVNGETKSALTGDLSYTYNYQQYCNAPTLPSQHDIDPYPMRA